MVLRADWSLSVNATSSSPEVGEPEGAPELPGGQQGQPCTGGHLAAAQLAFAAQQPLLEGLGGEAFRGHGAGGRGGSRLFGGRRAGGGVVDVGVVVRVGVVVGAVVSSTVGGVSGSGSAGAEVSSVIGIGGCERVQHGGFEGGRFEDRFGHVRGLGGQESGVGVHVLSVHLFHLLSCPWAIRRNRASCRRPQAVRPPEVRLARRG